MLLAAVCRTSQQAEGQAAPVLCRQSWAEGHCVLSTWGFEHSELAVASYGDAVAVPHLASTAICFAVVYGQRALLKRHKEEGQWHWESTEQLRISILPAFSY